LDTRIRKYGDFCWAGDKYANVVFILSVDKEVMNTFLYAFKIDTYCRYIFCNNGEVLTEHSKLFSSPEPLEF